MLKAYTLVYAHDPMCSWCWGFRPALQRLRSRLPAQVAFRPLLGGLAPDNDQAMPEAMQSHLQATWRRIAQRIPGTEFNFDFWRDCQPRRSTYPACRAVIAARSIDPSSEDAMIHAIQQAYYLRARNPSDLATLIELATELSLDSSTFGSLLTAPHVARQLQQEIAAARHLGLNSFPGLTLELPDGAHRSVTVDYLDVQAMLDTVHSLIA